MALVIWLLRYISQCDKGAGLDVAYFEPTDARCATDAKDKRGPDVPSMPQKSRLGQQNVEVATDFAGEEVGNFRPARYSRGMVVVRVFEHRMAPFFAQ